MKNLLRFLSFIAAAFLIHEEAVAQTQQLIYAGQFSGAANVLSTASVTFNSGSALQLQFGTVGANRLVIETNSSGLVGTVGLGAGLSISGGNLVAGSSSSANPTGKVGPSATNGILTTYMTSDSAPAIDLTATYPWTGLHSFSPTAVKTSGTDYGIEVTPTLNQRNATNFILIFGNETITQAGTGNQYLEELQVSGTDKWVVNSTGTLTVGTWTGSVIGSNYGGAGAIQGPLSGNGSGVVALATGGTGISVTTGGIAITSLVVTNSGLSLPSNSLVLGNGSPDTKVANGLSTDGISKVLLGIAGTSVGEVILANATSGTVTLAPVTGALGSNTISFPAASGTVQIFSGSSTTNDVPSFSNSTGSLQDPGVVAITSNQLQINVNDSGTVPFAIANQTSSVPQPAITILMPNLGTTDNVTMMMGEGSGTNNEGFWSFYYAGNLSSSNLQTWYFQNGSPLMQLSAGGIFTLTGTVASTTTATGTLVLSGSGAGLGVAGMASLGNLTVYNGATAATVQGALNLGGTAYSYGAASATGGAALVIPATTYTVTGGSPANFQAEYIGAPTFTDSTSGTMAQAASLTINGPPVAAGSLAFTNAYSLAINSGNVMIGQPSTVSSGFLLTTQGTTNGNLIALFSQNNSGGTSANNEFFMYNASNGTAFGITGVSYSGTFLSGGPSGQMAYYFTNASLPLALGANSAAALVITTGNALQITHLVSTYDAIATAGWGVPAIYGEGRFTAQNAAKATVATYTVGASDGNFIVDANVNVTTSTLHNFTVTVTYFDENNTSRTLTMGFTQLSGATLLTAITNATGAGPYESVPYHIRCKAATAITVATVGTFTTVTYNVEATIKQEG